MLVSKPSDCVRLELIGGYSDLVLLGSQGARGAWEKECEKKAEFALHDMTGFMSVLSG